MKKTLLLLVFAFALCSNTATAQQDSLLDIMRGRMKEYKDSTYTIEVSPQTADFMQLLTAITLAGDVPPKINYFLQPSSSTRFIIVPRMFKYPAFIGADYYECDYRYGQLKWHYNMHNQSCENVTIRVKSGNRYTQRGQVLDIQEGLYSLLEDVKHKRLYEIPVIDVRKKSELEILPSPVFTFLEPEYFKYDSVLGFYSTTVQPDVEGSAELFQLLNSITMKTKGSISKNTYQLVTPTKDIPIQEVIGSYYYQFGDISWYAEHGKVTQVHIYTSNISKLMVEGILYQHVLSLVANDIQQDKWTVDNRKL